MPSAVSQSSAAEIKPSDSVSNAASSTQGSSPKGGAKVTTRKSMRDPVDKGQGFGADKYLSFSRPRGSKDPKQLEVINTKKQKSSINPATKAEELKEGKKAFKAMKVKAPTAFLLRF